MTTIKPLTSETREIRHGRASDSVLDLEARHGHERAFSRLRAFMIEYLKPLRSSLPREIGGALEIAEQFRDHSRMNLDLQRARDLCWEYLSARNITYDFQNKDNCAVRAVLSTVQREPPQLDLGEACYWFLLFADEVCDRSASIDDLIQKYLK
jgi:hypothetical protein